VRKAEAMKTEFQDLATLRGKRRRSPYRRLVLLALFALTLPFAWGERTSCDGGTTRVFTGVDLFTADHGPGLFSVALIFLTPVLLGLLQHRIRNAALRLALELPAIFFGLFGTLYCFLAALYYADFFDRLFPSGSNGRVYLAPWIATLAQFLMAIDACQGAAERIQELLAARQQRRSPTAPEEEAKRSPPRRVRWRAQCH